MAVAGRPPALLSLGGILRHFVQLPFVIPSAILTRRRQSLVNTEVLHPLRMLSPQKMRMLRMLARDKVQAD